MVRLCNIKGKGKRFSLLVWVLAGCGLFAGQPPDDPVSILHLEAALSWEGGVEPAFARGFAG